MGSIARHLNNHLGDFQDAFYIVKNLFNGFNLILPSLAHIGQHQDILGTLGLSRIGCANICYLTYPSLIIFTEMIHAACQGKGIENLIKKAPLIPRWSLYYALILSIVFWGVFNHDSFIYFQF